MGGPPTWGALALALFMWLSPCVVHTLINVYLIWILRSGCTNDRMQNHNQCARKQPDRVGTGSGEGGGAARGNFKVQELLRLSLDIESEE